jgi:hypothetical protein
VTTYHQETLMPEPHVPILPEPNDLPVDKDGKPLGGDATWSAFRGKHQPCGRCVRIIHQKLWNHHPHPARQRRKGPNGEELLCVQHAEMQRTRDQKVKAHLESIRKSQRNVRGR